MHIAIIGGGLSGLVLGYKLQQKGIHFTIFESQQRVGGRIMTVAGENNTPMEMGATWFADYHQNLMQLLQQLDLGYFPQHTEGNAILHTRSFEPPQKFYMAASEQLSYRIKGGSSTLINTLVEYIHSDNIKTDTSITHLQYIDDNIILTDNKDQNHNIDMVVLSMPPQLIRNIQIKPELPKELNDLLPSVHTWMSGSIKFALEYASPFWRDNGYSGTIFCHTGLAVEVYDQSNFEEDTFALVGFLNGVAMTYSKLEREEIVVAQLKVLFGDIVPKHLTYTDKIWNDQYIRSPNEVPLQPHFHNGHPLLRKPYMDSRLYISGAESSHMYPGYMEGAVFSANEVFVKIISKM